MPKIILTDVDGVLLDWENAFHDWMKERGWERDPDKVSYHMTTVYPGLDDEKRKELIREFNESARMGYLEPLRDSVHYVKMLHERHGYKLVCITSMTTNKYANWLREKNLKTLFGDRILKELVCLDVGEDKVGCLKYFTYEYSGHLWIEDKMANVDAGVEAGYDCLIMNHEYNSKYSGPAYRVNNWQGVYDYCFNPKVSDEWMR